MPWLGKVQFKRWLSARADVGGSQAHNIVYISRDKRDSSGHQNMLIGRAVSSTASRSDKLDGWCVLGPVGSVFGSYYVSSFGSWRRTKEGDIALL
jgi:hypothetical protein